MDWSIESSLQQFPFYSKRENGLITWLLVCCSSKLWLLYQILDIDSWPIPTAKKNLQ